MSFSLTRRNAPTQCSLAALQKVDLTSRKYAAARLWHARRLGLRIIKMKD